jgi:hypothetical protein
MILNGVSMLSSDIGQAHCDTARYFQDNIPTKDNREAARRALRRRSGAKAATNEGRVAMFKPAGAYRLKEMERVKGIEPSS